MVYFVYRIKINVDGLFYIGVTNDFDKRKAAHISCIKNCIHRILLRWPKRTTDFPCHILFAKALTSGRTGLIRNYEAELKRCKFKVLQVFDTAEDARELETKLLKKYKANPKLVNSQKESRYGKKVSNILRHSDSTL